MISVDLPEPETPGHAAEDAERDRDVDSLEVVFARVADEQGAARLAPLVRNLDAPLPGEVLAGQRGRVAGDLLRRPLRDHVAAVFAGPRTEVDEVVGGEHRALVVLDDDHRVAEVAQPVEGPDQLLVVALVQPDRGLVEHVHDADQAGADLRREADPLRLAAGERARRAGEREVADADVVEEGEPFGDLADDQASDRALGVGHLELVDPLGGGARREVAVLGDAEPADLDREALGAQAGAAAIGAGLLGHVALDPLAVALRVGLFVAALELVEDPLEAHLVGATAAEAIGVGDVVALAAGAVQEDLALALLQLLPGHVHVDAVLLGDGRDQPPPVGGDAAVPRLQRALGQREGRVGDDEVRVDHFLEAEPVAAVAGPVRRVEGEDPRLELGDRGPALEAGEFLREEQRLAASGRRPSRRRTRSRPGRRRSTPPPRPTRRAAAAGPASSPAGRRRSRCRVCTSCRERSPRRGGAARRRSAPANTPPGASARAASRTRLCGRGRPAP